MRVLHVLHRSLPCAAGYTARSAAVLASQAALGLEPVALISTRQEGAPASERIHGVVDHRTSTPVARDRLGGAAFQAVEMAALRRRILDVGACVDLIHAHSPIQCGLPAHAAARRLGVPSVYEIRAFWEDAMEQPGHGRQGSARYAAVRALETRLACAADAVVVVSDGLRRDFLARGVPEDRVFLVPHGVDTARFAPRARDDALAARLGFRDKRVLAYVGRLSPCEGVSLFLDALARVLAVRDDVCGLVAGAGEDDGELRAQHARLGLGDRVVITSAPAEDEDLYALADVVVHPRARHRITEAVTPLGPLEAMSMGKLVVGSDVGGLRELVRDGETGLLFRAGDATDLEHVLLRGIDDTGLMRRVGENARAWTVEERGWGHVAAGYFAVYATAKERAAA